MDIYRSQRQNDCVAKIWMRRTLIFWAVLLALLNTRTSIAEINATISVSPDTGVAGEIFVISGSGFTPGAATLFWDSQAVSAFTIPRDGFFETILVAPSFTPSGEHKITVCAGAPCLTGQAAQAASQTIKIVGPMTVFSAQIAFIHAGDTVSLTDAVQFQQLLQAYGPDVRLIKKDEIAAHDFSQYDLVIVGSSTGKEESWGTSDEIAQLDKSRRILGLGEGGHALFGGMKLEIGYPYATREITTGIVETPNPGLIFQKIPHGLGAFTQRALEVYTSSGYAGYAMTFKDVSSNVTPLAAIALLQDPQMPVIVNQGCRSLWGFNDGPGKMTAAGRALFANTVFFALGTPCDFDTRTSCAALSSPSEIPSTRQINFDDLKETTLIGDLYRQSHGVIFEDGRVAKATIKTDEANAHSSPNVAFNSHSNGNNSSNVPMPVEFEREMSHVGVWLGNGDANLRATLRAYNVQGEEICNVVVPTVSGAHTTFAGIYDALGRIARLNIDYGSSLRSESIDDLTFGAALYAEQIRICRAGANGCVPVPNAPVHHLREGKETGEIFFTDSDGYVIERGKVAFGDMLWAKIPMSDTELYTFYHTTAAPVPVTPDAFDGGTMTIEIGYPLMAFNLDLSTQWDISFDTAYQAELRTRIEEASNHLYDFTDGQMALGKVIVYQNYDGWTDADIRLYTSNTTRPKAEIGGVVTGPTTDPLIPEVIYYPGHVHMGSTWSRYGTAFVPPGTLINQDWALALAHELGHYLLYLYDTYLSLNENNEPVEIDSCTGSAMGWAYEEPNTEFVFDLDHWNSACGITLANQVLKRTEWATIRLWYADLIQPTVVNPGPAAPPVSLTEVNFQPPSTPTTPGVNQTFDLLYADGESASAAARAFLIRGQRVLDQGQPISGTTSITLNGASTGDRFCLFDIRNAGLSRRQFGCKEVTVGDNDLRMKKDLSWAPVIELTVVTSQTVAISVTQALDNGQTLSAVLYPEDQNQATPINLTRSGTLYTGDFLSPIPATSAYVSVHVNEAESESDPRREVMVEYGTGGSGAFGPAHRLPGVPIISGDGQAEYASNETLELEEGEFIAWQSMAGSPSSPGSGEIIGTSYRLMAVPPQLAEGGTIAIRLPDTPIPTTRRLAQAQELTIHLWQDGEWIPLESQQVTNPQEGAKVTARSQGVGIYALLAPAETEKIYLPAVQR